MVAYIFAAPVGPKPVCANPNNCIIPGNPTLLSDPVAMANGTGANKVDTITGFLDWSDLNGNNVVDQNEFTVVPGSLLQQVDLRADAVRRQVPAAGSRRPRRSSSSSPATTPSR